MPDQDISKVIVAGTLILLFLGACIVIFALMYHKRQNKYRLEKQEMEQRFREELLRSQLEIQEQTLRGISQEIHDNIGQTLSLVKLNLNTMDLQKPGALDEKIAHSKALVGKVITDLRSLSRSLNTDSVLAAGLIPAIESALALVRHTGLFEAELKVQGEPRPLGFQKELILFRIVQEGVNNALKHSGARTIRVLASYQSSSLSIEIRDDGKGWDPSGSTPEGSGLRNMKSRAGLIGGSFDLQSTKNGTTIMLTVPIDTA